MLMGGLSVKNDKNRTNPDSSAHSNRVMPHALSDEEIEELLGQFWQTSDVEAAEQLVGHPLALPAEEHREPAVADDLSPLPSATGGNASALLSPDADLPPETAKINLHKGHREKVKQRFIDEGLDSFQDHQILELLLFFAIPQKDTNELAHRLLNAHNNSLSEVLGADVDTLVKFDGVGKSTAVLLSMLPQLFRRYREDLMQRRGIFGRKAVEDYIANRFTGERVEKVLVVCLDNRWNYIGDGFASTGSVNFSTVDIRKFVGKCLHLNATKAIMAHNHPRGTALPSRDDLQSTLRVKQALEAVGIQLIDHIIVAQEDYISLACSKQYCDLF